MPYVSNEKYSCSCNWDQSKAWFVVSTNSRLPPCSSNTVILTQLIQYHWWNNKQYGWLNFPARNTYITPQPLISSVQQVLSMQQILNSFFFNLVLKLNVNTGLYVWSSVGKHCDDKHKSLRWLRSNQILITFRFQYI